MLFGPVPGDFTLSTQQQEGEKVMGKQTGEWSESRFESEGACTSRFDSRVAQSTY